MMMVAAACSAEPEPGSVTAAPESPFADCAALAAPPSAASSGPVGPADLPDLALPCFTGEQPVKLAALRGPAVINFWASWCGPCREELPAMQRLADATTGRLTVLSVNTGDARDAAASFGAAKNVTLPTLYDRERKLAAALGQPLLPVTVFLDAAGRRHVDPLPLDEARLAASVRTHAGVTVTP
ncbi:TlpA family protein disulfide reductase [Jidongwangia harbinensis]|uniref:TlpA family protein disulfide reductase n=1 Tax=Jidongwangia harbinensis TaxID=2878561 RepID=UPI001CD97A43|nr:TlpA disulfide reductase family protein [Jidongwangia harbinensis]MCA2215849.1 TlpA family protein disulfide reductase [Jidongwangia harbinensis]